MNLGPLYVQTLIEDRDRWIKQWDALVQRGLKHGMISRSELCAGPSAAEWAEYRAEEEALRNGD